MLGSNVDGVEIGGGTPGDDNLISGNTTAGIEVKTGAENVTILGNKIGTDIAGTAAAATTTATGIAIAAAAAGSSTGTGTVIGGGGSAGENIIAFNSGSAIAIFNTQEEAVEIRRNITFDNGFGIDLGADGAVLANDANDTDANGANLLQNFPEITASLITAVNVVVNYSVESTEFPVTIEFYRSTADGELNEYLFTETVNDALPKTALQLLSSFSTPPAANDIIVAKATDNLGNTSEISPTSTAQLQPEVTQVNYSYSRCLCIFSRLQGKVQPGS